MDPVTKTIIDCGQIILSDRWVDNTPPSKDVIMHVVLELKKLSIAKAVDMDAVYQDLVQKFHGGQMCAKNLAQQFISILHQHLTVEQIETIVDRNTKEPDSRICHTHDFIDANEAMAEALIQGGFGEYCEQLNPLINEAWTIAQKNNFK